MTKGKAKEKDQWIKIDKNKLVLDWSFKIGVGPEDMLEAKKVEVVKELLYNIVGDKLIIVGEELRLCIDWDLATRGIIIAKMLDGENDTPIYDYLNNNIDYMSIAIDKKHDGVLIIKTIRNGIVIITAEHC